MMSIAEVISMAMAELLIVVLKASGRRGRTYDDPKTILEENLYRNGGVVVLVKMVVMLMMLKVTMLKLE